MELFLASANEKEIKSAYDLPIAGILTNSNILGKEGKSLKELTSVIDKIGTLEFGLQIASTDEAGMMAEYRLFRSLIKNRKLHLKIPFCRDAFKVIRNVSNSDIIKNLTAISTMPQAFIALEAEIDYLSIYISRVSNAGGDGLKLLADIKKYAYDNSKKTKILAASIHNMAQLIDVAKAGADAVAIPYHLLYKALQSEVTDKSINGFKEDWGKIGKE